TPQQMVAAGFNPLELAARNWVEGMQTLEQGIALIPSSQLLEVRYEQLLQDPCDQLQRILEFMEVKAKSDETFWEIIASLQIAPKQEEWVRNWSESELGLVLAIQNDALRRWGYITADK
ncbi:sulfotransferase, partial [Nitrosomonas sp.]|uniref:sulfotransferase n=1 Tax=Nitrosomonas sp. TaxID=42353 RepID=UPI0025E48FE3